MSETRQRLIARFDKNSIEEVQVNFTDWKGETHVDIRTWVKLAPGEDGNVAPTTRGIRLHSELMGQLRSAIDAVIEALENGPEVEVIQDGVQGAGEDLG